MKQISLTKGYVALVDDEDFERVIAVGAWRADVHYRKNGTVRTVYAVSGEKKTYLHRLIMGVTNPKTEVDHHDHDGLNCQKYNLRVCGRSQNESNSRKWAVSTTSSRFKGVSWDKRCGKWQAGIVIGWRRKHLGRFTSEEAAARAYDAAAKRLFGEFALVNFN